MYPNRPVYVVDWDGTCVEEIWPDMGDWLPGAIDSLHELASRGKTVVYSTRLNVMEYGHDEIRPSTIVETETQLMREMLDQAGLRHVDIYPSNLGKPPGEFYIDDKALSFSGNWTTTMEMLNAAEAARNLAASVL